VRAECHPPSRPDPHAQPLGEDAVLRRTSWRIDGPQGAARLLDVRPSTLRSRIRKLGIRRSHDAS
jgi:hypothetical protein